MLGLLILPLFMIRNMCINRLTASCNFKDIFKQILEYYKDRKIESYLAHKARNHKRYSLSFIFYPQKILPILKKKKVFEVEKYFFL